MSTTRTALVLWLMAMPIIGVHAAAVPDLAVRIAVRQEEDAKLGRGIHVMDLRCLDGVCSLTWVSLNQCDPDPVLPQARSFPLGIERSSTEDGTLRVRFREGIVEAVEGAEVISGSHTTRLLFGIPKAAVKNQVVTKLTSFSGAFVKHSKILNQVIMVRFVPLADDHSVVDLDCGVRLPGITTANRRQN